MRSRGGKPPCEGPLSFAKSATLIALSCMGGFGCAGSNANSQATWPESAKKWFERADASYRTADIEDAELAVANALRVLPDQPEVRTLAARIALARLEYDRAIQLLGKLDDSDARAIRGRAYWYAGEVSRAADELEKLVADPEVRDPWATEVAKLARRGGRRKPFKMSGNLVAVSDMPQVASTSPGGPIEI